MAAPPVKNTFPGMVHNIIPFFFPLFQLYSYNRNYYGP